MGDIHVYQDPVYIKHRDLKYIRTRVTTTLLCNCVNNHLHSTTASVGAQHLKFCWALFVKTSEARNEFIENGLTIYGVTLTVHKENPVDTSPSEKLVLKDLPIPIPDSDILQSLRDTFPDYTFKLDVIKARDQIRRNVYSEFITGDRFVYVKAPLPAPFPHNSILMDNRCSLWHSTQNVRCKRCSSTSHSTENYLSCPAYVANQDIRLVRDPMDPLCNWFPCDMVYNGVTFASSEHAYLYTRCMMT